MRRHPQRVRAAVLDGVSPLDVDFVLPFAVNAQHVFDALADECARDAACHGSFPDPRRDSTGAGALPRVARARFRAGPGPWSRDGDARRERGGDDGPLPALCTGDARMGPRRRPRRGRGQRRGGDAVRGAGHRARGGGVERGAVPQRDLRRRRRRGDGARRGPRDRRYVPRHGARGAHPARVHVLATRAHPGRLPRAPAHRCAGVAPGRDDGFRDAGHDGGAPARLRSERTRIVVPGGGHGVSEVGCVPAIVARFVDTPAAPLDTSCVAAVETKFALEPAAGGEGSLR